MSKKAPSIVTATVRAPKPAKPRKRPPQWGVTWYDIEARKWVARWFQTDKSECEPLAAELRQGNYDADPATVRIVEIPGE